MKQHWPCVGNLTVGMLTLFLRVFEILFTKLKKYAVILNLKVKFFIFFKFCFVLKVLVSEKLSKLNPS